MRSTAEVPTQAGPRHTIDGQRLPTPSRCGTEHASQLKAIFDEMDEDGNGTIDKDEWRSAMPKIGLTAEEKVA